MQPQHVCTELNSLRAKKAAKQDIVFGRVSASACVILYQVII